MKIKNLLVEAAENLDVNRVKELITEQEIDPNLLPSKIIQKLMDPTNKVKQKIIKLLLKNGLQIKDKKLSYALLNTFLLQEEHNVSTIKVLLDYLPQKNIKEWRDQSGNNILAALLFYPSVLSKGLSEYRIRKYNKELVQQCIQLKLYINHVSLRYPYETVLGITVRMGYTDLVQLLIDKGAKIDLKHKNAPNLLNFLIKQTEEKYYKIIEILVNKHIDLEFELPDSYNKKSNLLAWVIKAKNITLQNLIFENYKDISKYRNEAITAALSQNDFSLVKKLWSKKKIHLVAEWLKISIENDHINITDFILRKTKDSLLQPEYDQNVSDVLSKIMEKINKPKNKKYYWNILLQLLERKFFRYEISFVTSHFAGPYTGYQTDYTNLLEWAIYHDVMFIQKILENVDEKFISNHRYNAIITALDNENCLFTIRQLWHTELEDDLFKPQDRCNHFLLCAMKLPNSALATFILKGNINRFTTYSGTILHRFDNVYKVNRELLYTIPLPEEKMAIKAIVIAKRYLYKIFQEFQKFTKNEMYNVIEMILLKFNSNNRIISFQIIQELARSNNGQEMLVPQLLYSNEQLEHRKNYIKKEYQKLEKAQEQNHLKMSR